MTTEELLFCLLRNEIYGKTLQNNFTISKNEIERLYQLSKNHDLSHLIGNAIIRNNLLPVGKELNAFKQQMLVAVYRYEQQNAVFEKIRDLFIDSEIEFIPLKGSVMKTLYPEPWMRTSCDIDILIHEYDIEKATRGLVKVGFNTDGKQDVKHISFYSGNVHLELHFNICENNKQMDIILKKVWYYTESISKYEYREISEFFVLHHITHMAHHFLSGGCGIRPFIDLWILKQKGFYNEDKLLPLLKECNLYKFYRSACQLSEVWMNDEKHHATTLQMEKYVLSGGVYGSTTNANTVGAATNNGKVRYLLSIAFLPYSSMCVIYPSLKKHKILLPFCYIHRMFVKIFGKDKKRTKERINSTISQSEENISEISNMLKELELSK